MEVNQTGIADKIEFGRDNWSITINIAVSCNYQWEGLRGEVQGYLVFLSLK